MRHMLFKYFKGRNEDIPLQAAIRATQSPRTQKAKPVLNINQEAPVQPGTIANTPTDE
jgi:hypothetical protein